MSYIFIFITFIVGTANAQMTITNATLQTEPVKKSVDVDATGSKANVELLKFTEGAANPFISCAVSSGSSQTSFTWTLSNSSEIPAQAGAVPVRVPKTGTLDTMRVVGRLTFTNVVEKAAMNIGEYKCVSGDQVGKPAVHSAPVASMGGREYLSSLESEMFAMHCSVIAYPDASVTWSKNNQTEVLPSERVKFSPDNRTLTIATVEKSDAGLYICTAQNRLGLGQAYVKLRVKDRLAALWPFLGILLEVAVLAVIIILYEKNRAARKRSQENEDAIAADIAAGGSGGGGGGAGGGGRGAGASSSGGGRNANDSDLRHRPVRA